MPRPKPSGQEEIDNNFAYHPATEVTGPQHDEVRTQARNLASKWNKALPAGRHKAMAISFLQQAMWAANTAIACDTTDGAAEPEPEAEDEPTQAEPVVAKKAAPAKAPAKKAVSRTPRKAAAKAPAAPAATVTPIKSAGTRRPRAQRAAQG